MSGASARTDAVTRAALRHCLALRWAPLVEVPLPDGSRADILALRPDGGIVILEVKSGARDFLADAKWSGYAEWCDLFLFVVDSDFPLPLLPPGVGVWVAGDGAAVLWREPSEQRLAPARRRALTLAAARLAATRLAFARDPGAAAEVRAALRAD